MTFLKEIETHWSGRVESYNSSVEKQLATGRSDKWISEVLRDVPAGKKLKVLDVGCGPGFFEMGLASYGFELVGIDYNQDMVNKASENCRERGITAEFRKMDAQNLEFEDNTFDLVVSRDVLWNLDDPRRAYEEMYRVLKPEGKITVFDGNYYLYAHDKAYEEMNVDRCIKIYHNNDQSNKERLLYVASIATQLPSSRYRRPQWDLSILIEMGMDRVTATMDRENEVTFEEDGKARRLPYTFSVSGFKN